MEAVPLEGLAVAEVEGQYAGFLYWFVGQRPWFDPQVERHAHIVEVQWGRLSSLPPYAWLQG